VSQIRRVLAQSIESSGGPTSLSQIGVSFQRDGTLAVDDEKLEQAIDQNLEGVGNLFAATGRTADARIEFLGSLPQTQAGSFPVSVSRLATSGSLVGSAMPNLTISAGINDQIDLSVDGIATSVTLRAGAYASASDLAGELQTQLAGAGRSVFVTTDGGVVSIHSSTFGGTSVVSLTGGNGASDLLGESPVATGGLNVAGTINGVNALGSGQTLTGAAGDASAGLSLKVIGGSLGERGNVVFSRGCASMLDALVGGFLGEDGLLSSRTDGINATIRRIGQSQEALQTRMDQVEKRYRAQFTALDATISNLQQTSSFLSQQLAVLTKNND
jgi:flagellar hook-associated protein 2